MDVGNLDMASGGLTNKQIVSGGGCIKENVVDRFYEKQDTKDRRPNLREGVRHFIPEKPKELREDETRGGHLNFANHDGVKKRFYQREMERK